MRRWLLIPMLILSWLGGPLGDGAAVVSAQETEPTTTIRAPWAAGADLITARKYRDPAGVELVFALVEYASAADAGEAFDPIAVPVADGLIDGRTVKEPELGDRAIAMSGRRQTGGVAALVMVQEEAEILVLLATATEDAPLPDLLALATVVVSREGEPEERLPNFDDLPEGSVELGGYTGVPVE
jgi:hypothetical protein